MNNRATPNRFPVSESAVRQRLSRALRHESMYLSKVRGFCDYGPWQVFDYWNNLRDWGDLDDLARRNGNNGTGVLDAGEYVAELEPVR